MSAGKLILCCVFTSFAVHYGWKMRGTLVGGEKGAMLPGLLAGLSLALFSGGGIAEYFWIPAAAGLIGMSYGGIEPYGDTIAFIEDPALVEPNPRKGYAGLALKGALWFSVGSGFIGISLSAMGGRYKPIDIILFPFCVIVSQIAGYCIFNQPYNKEKNIVPKIYFSFESREEWGSNIGVVITLLAFIFIRKDCLSLCMTLAGMLFGAVGWIAAMKLYLLTELPMKNGKYFFGVLARKHLVGGWGNMEFCLGSIGGLGISAGYAVSSREIVKINESIIQNGLFNPFDIPETVTTAAVCICFILLMVINSGLYIYEKKGHKYSYFLWDCIERPVFNTLPFVTVFMCRVESAKLLTAFMLVYVLCLKTWFDRFEKEQHRSAYMLCSGITALVIFTLTIMIKSFPSPVWVIFCGTVLYIVSDIIWNITNEKRGKSKIIKTLNSVSMNWILLALQSVVLLICSHILTV